MNAKRLTVLEALAEIRHMISESNRLSGVSALPVVKRTIGGRYFARVKGKRSASLRMRSRKRKLSR